ncbi:MAG: aminotransferase class IV [Pseudomonadota bacterium]
MPEDLFPAAETTTAPLDPAADYSHGAAWMQGRIVPMSEARLPVNDWGVTRSDAVYDVAPVWDGAFVGLDRYLDRFMASLDWVRMEIPVDREGVREILHRIVAASGLRESYVAMVCTRGLPLIPGTRDPRTCRQNFYCWCVPYIWVIPQEVAERGARLFVPTGEEAVRRIPEQSLNPRAKNYHWADFTQALMQGLDEGYDTAAVLDMEGNVSEGPGFNLFAVTGDRLVTPARGVLEGRTRGVVMELAESLGLQVEARALPLEEFLEADEVFLSTTGGGPAPIVDVNGRVFGNGAPGTRTLALKEAYRRWLTEGPEREPVNYG